MVLEMIFKFEHLSVLKFLGKASDCDEKTRLFF